ncbi:MAG: 23S rRNA (pseudouridine(1915)-N(3))-methyltransferase RlmH [Candidatus Dadabacteria bacterium]|nr:MAG: 23S rRNA (pseudouridine(1915)-N(3))-methyltransferase RlmH [Candidatus Dadabacteria bacterium]
MKIELHLAFRLRGGPAAEMIRDWGARIARQRSFEVIERAGRRPFAGNGWTILCDPAGTAYSTEQMARQWRERELSATPLVRVLIGGADGWPGDAQAQTRWAFGQITMPHELAAAVATEQIYRILTILTGHPYHVGH